MTMYHSIAINTPLLALLFLFCSLSLSALTTAILKLGRTQAHLAFKTYPHLFFFSYFLKLFAKEKRSEALFFFLSSTKQLLQLLYAAFAFIFLLFLAPVDEPLLEAAFWGLIIPGALLIILIAFLCDLAMRLLSALSPLAVFKTLSPVASLSLSALFFLTFPFYKLFSLVAPLSSKRKTLSSSFQMKERLLDMLNEAETVFDESDKRLMLSVASFKDRIAREVMVPRIDLFALPSSLSIHEAAPKALEQGYSRIPVYQESIDQIVGVLLYKDVLNAYIKKEDLDVPIETLIKPVLYTPETKRLSLLLQEFRNKQSHLAIVVDEYGGTEGIVTIEDILEELVGEIADEYDTDEETLYSHLSTGEWVVDAKMTLIDIEEELGIRIPQSAEYDTLGGYIFHRAGAIPTPGWRLHHDDFDLEVILSTERSVEKVRIMPHRKEGKEH